MKPFTPEKLPLHNKIDPLFFYNTLIEASTNLGKYQVMLESSKDADLLIDPLLLQEAVQSTKIEGTQVTFDEVLESEVDEADIKSDDIKEVINYSKALKYGRDSLSKIPISTRLFKKLHRILLSDGVRGGNRAPGEYRTVQNFIGPEGCTIETANFVPSEPHLVNDYISNLEKYINEPNDELHPLIRVSIIHAQFETIHPFLDGNGRVGRILIPLYLFEHNVIDYPNFFISETLEKDKHKYYRLLNETRIKDNWNQWIQFFLESVNRQATKNLELIKNINRLYEKDLTTAMNIISNSNVIKIIDVMFKLPIFNVKRMTELTGISDTTCRRYLNKLEEEHLIFSNDKLRGKKYYYYNLLDLIR